MAEKKPKYYAVRVGRVPGIYRTWAECEPLVLGFEGARYKSFPTLEQAQAYLGEELAAPREAEDSTPRTRKKDSPGNGAEDLFPIAPDTLVAFVDGSYDAGTKRYGYGCVLLHPNGEETRLNGVGDHPEAVSARNVAGELLATLVALREAERMGFAKVIVCHDYNGIALWYQGKWRANSYVAREYIAAAEAYRGRLSVSFRKIAAHTGVTCNEEADRLAKQALGIVD